MMKICFLANGASEHTVRWATSMAGEGCQVDIISFDDAVIPGANVHYIKPVKRERNSLPSAPKNLSYIAKSMEVKSIVKKIKPDILHAHYATGYGLTGALCNYHPLVISTWGTDIFDAPRKNRLFKNLVRYNLKKADYITATSQALTRETMLYTEKKVHTIPFGIDTSRFFKYGKADKNKVTIGIVKSLEEVYGIRYLIEAFGRVHSRHKNTELLIVGSGSKHKEMQELSRKLNLEGNVIFAGKVPNEEVPLYLNKMDIFVMPSIKESFGVAALEAQACEVPVIASNVGGIPEVVVDNHTGFLVEPSDIDILSEKIEKLVLGQDLREAMGRNGRVFVEEKYSWDKNVMDMYNLYREIIEQHNRKR